MTSSEAHPAAGLLHVVAKQGNFVDGFWSSWFMILVSEIGDKTFFIALLLAMRYNRGLIFAGAISALAVQTVISALMGVIVPTLLTVRVTQTLAVFLFTGFGIKILRDTLATKAKGGGDDEESSDDERAEAAAAIGPKEGDVEEGTGHLAAANIRSIFIQAFTLTFVAEWGDRSQIATIALAAAKNPFGVTAGGILGHSICTGGAVMAGNFIASHVSMRTVNLMGGALFIFFGIYTAWELYSTSGATALITTGDALSVSGHH